ncbi:thiamin pyrophosphokinase [Planotetraspora thailandica]|uniref:Thiamin pyrophosphokinase n=1 Tax=Planotetraspora thailandica TaxID=487172 RepID=A0A8J3UTA1_9ACTN|nr:putative cytokinetic ring protein SteA [Planotetraspora thailandica]GII51624.1 thiamin pyrophosphokinase [Planotetraspora thailandica]
MKVLSLNVPGLRRRKVGDLPGVTAVARIDRRTKRLTKRLNAGEIAIIDHVDVDRVSGEALVACGAAAVVNVATGISGRYPNLGPQILLDAGIPVVDNASPELFERISDGDVVRVHEGMIYLDDEVVGKGEAQTQETVAAAMAEARAGLAVQIEAFAANTMEYVKRERDLLIDGVGVPDIRTSVEGRHVLIVVRGYHYKEDIATLRPYIREYRPVLIGVDGGADALVEAGYTPHIIIGDFDSVSEKALSCGAELVVHAYRDGRAPGLERVEQLGKQAVVFPATGTSEDIAMLLADDKGASLIVAVGTHWTLDEFLDKGRSGMASTFLTRLRIGSKLVDAKGVSRLYRSRISTSSLLLLVATTLITIGVVLSVSPIGQVWLNGLRVAWNGFIFWLVGLFS